jgi:lysophospholipase L1-like esterase
MTRKHRIAPLALVAVLAACVSNESLEPPDQAAGLEDALFARYVAFGNSITAGFQSGGINDSVQVLSYANLLAGQMGTEFNMPLLNRPGCPPPYLNIFTQTPVGNPGPLGCALRNPSVPERLHNVAIPGAGVLDIYDPLGTGNFSNTLTQVIGGSRSQVENAAEVQPTFVTVWIGNNDALGAATNSANPGNPALVTPPATFAARYDAMIDSLTAFGTIEGGVLIGVVQVGVAPFFTQGRAWKGFELQFDALTAPLNAFDVGNACLTFTALTATDTAWTSVPFTVGGPALALANARVDSVGRGLLPPQNLVPVVIDCADATAITNTEMANLVGAITQYNAAIEAAAADVGWIYIDPNDLLLTLIGAPGAILPFPAFPGLPGVTAEMSQNTPFGTALSRDGIHPSTSTHRLVANALIQAINGAYGTSIPALN